MKEDTLKTLVDHPFEPWTLKLRRPLQAGEVTVHELVLHPPEVKDILMTDGYKPESVGYTVAFASALSGLPEIMFRSMVPEDYADLLLVLRLQNARFTGEMNILDKKAESGNPTQAALTQPQTSGTTSGE